MWKLKRSPNKFFKTKKQPEPKLNGCLAISDKQWREASWNGKLAKQLLIGIEFPNGAKIKEAVLEGGEKIAIANASEDQCKELIRKILPQRLRAKKSRESEGQ